MSAGWPEDQNNLPLLETIGVAQAVGYGSVVTLYTSVQEMDPNLGHFPYSQRFIFCVPSGEHPERFLDK